jgi:proteic killer suppression protein
MDFAHKGLRALYELNNARRLNAGLVTRIERILSDLDAAEAAHDMNRPGYRLHALKGDQRGLWSVRVSGNWRIVFRFVAGDAVDVDLIDYH